MASTQIYLQKMFADMQAALSAVQSDMASLGGKVDAQIIELQNTVDAIGQIATTSAITSVDADKTKIVRSDSFLFTSIATTAFTGIIKCKATGNFKMRCVFNNTYTAALGFTILYSKNGAADTTLDSSTIAIGTGKIYTSPAISAVDGDTFVFKISAAQGNKLTVTEAALLYKVHNLITDSPFIL